MTSSSGVRSWIRSYVADPEQGPLPALLLMLTVVAGLVDAVSILSLGRVFVANMTGNVAFIAFALAGAPGFSLAASFSALGGFLVGAAGGGWIITRTRGHRGVILRRMVAVQLTVMIIALLTFVSTGASSATVKSMVAFLVATAMGTQNATVRVLGVPDFTTTVLTRTLTAIAAGFRDANPAVVIRRSIAVVFLFVGALVGAVIVLQVNGETTLGIATALLAVVAAVSAVVSRGEATWHHRVPPAE